jgi:hypothetical protein
MLRAAVPNFILYQLVTGPEGVESVEKLLWVDWISKLLCMIVHLPPGEGTF